MMIAKGSEEGLLRPHILAKTDTLFELKSSPYLNVTVTSTVTVSMVLCAPPGLISYLVESADGSDSTVLTLRDLQPEASYFMQKEDLQETVFTTDTDGCYSYTQDLSERHYISIQSQKSTVYIYSSTVLTSDIYDSVVIAADNTVVDLNGHSIVNPGGNTVGLYFGGSGITVRNGAIRGFDSCGVSMGGHNNALVDVTIEDNFDGISLTGSDNILCENRINNQPSMGLLIWGTSNKIFDNTFYRTYDVGVLSIWNQGNNMIYHNNFVYNALGRPAQAEWWPPWGGPGGPPDIWDAGYPAGGNYWTDYRGSDGNSDGIGDTPYDIVNIYGYPSGQKDRYPLMNAWTLVPDQQDVQVSKGGVTYDIGLYSTPAITDVTVGRNQLAFDVSGPEGTMCYFSATLPIGLNRTEIRVILNGTRLAPPPYPVITSNGTHYFIVFAETFASTYQVMILFDPVPADVNIDPDTLNLSSCGNYITAYIEIPEANVNDIITQTILLNYTIPLSLTAPMTIGDYDHDGTPDLMIKFDRAIVESFVCEHIDRVQLWEAGFESVVLTVSGAFIDGMPFAGDDIIRVVSRIAKMWQIYLNS